MIVCAYLRGVFETLVARDPFVPENAKRFTAIGIVLAVMEGSGMFVAMIVNLAFGVFFQQRRGGSLPLSQHQLADLDRRHHLADPRPGLP